MAVKIVDASALTACCSTSRKRQPSPTDGRTEVSWRPLCWASIAEVDHADTLRLAEAFGLSSYDAEARRRTRDPRPTAANRRDGTGLVRFDSKLDLRPTRSLPAHGLARCAARGQAPRSNLGPAARPHGIASSRDALLAMTSIFTRGRIPLPIPLPGCENPLPDSLAKSAQDADSTEIFAARRGLFGG
jgi:hypothetical protein